MTEGKKPIQADGDGAIKPGADGVSESGAGGGAGQSAGGAYPNPHSTAPGGKGAGDFTGGQSGKDYHGPGQLGGEKADRDKSGRVGQGG